MNKDLVIHNTLSNKKETFKSIIEGHIGMYVCGPTVYSDVHLGNCRTFVSFDVIFRYLKYLGYKVRYVRNITDVGHLEGDVDTGAEDKIAKKARIEQLEPMELVQRYTLGFHEIMNTLNTEAPSIEPRATGHIIEQIEMVQAIIDNGFAYEKNGSVYFNTIKFAKDKDVYGQLSGRILEDLMVETRELNNQSEKENPADFAIWIKADESHIMRWNSPWSVGFPGWHLECSAMSTKYLGKTFDIHGGGNDLKFPHHENEIAQNFGSCGCQPANYWLHTNMLLMNGKKMSKSIDPETGVSNSITPEELFTGDNANISKAFSPMVIRFFMLQSHYRSTLDLTDAALIAAEKGYRRLMEANKILQGFAKPENGIANELDSEINELIEKTHTDMSNDFNTPMAMARLFELVPKINGLKEGHLLFTDLTADTLDKLKQTFSDFIYTIFGLKDELDSSASGNSSMDGLMQLVIELRQGARESKDWGTSDKIRDTLAKLEIQLKDGKEGTSWSKN